ncbi:hypothetical protein PR048_019528 [Dryococelus australis]|uniref:Uncharacterized protein n=1 Tax=Dryococelus australis TaxID=614101 RepID=A0ABQ9H3Q0_9NEOP|nr:hypothetical protein PR048_019528 [Dryococelus australis]
MVPETEWFENGSRHIKNDMYSYKTIYERKRVTTQSTLETFVRCRTQNNTHDPQLSISERGRESLAHKRLSLHHHTPPVPTILSPPRPGDPPLSARDSKQTCHHAAPALLELPALPGMARALITAKHFV